MNAIHAPIRAVRRFVVDYAARHAHPVNALLHVVGVPLTVVGLVIARAVNVFS